MNTLEAKQERYNLDSLENQREIAGWRRKIVQEAKIYIQKSKTYCKHCGKPTNSASLCGSCNYKIHKWVRERLPKPIACQKCGIDYEKLNLTNNSQYYAYDLDDWEYLCVGCHNKKDGLFRNSIDSWHFKRNIINANRLAVEFVKDRIRKEEEKRGVYLDYVTGKRISI